MSYQGNARGGSDNSAGLTATIVSDLRSDERLLETLGDGEQPGDGTTQIRTPLTAPDLDSIPPALLLVDVQAVGRRSRGQPTGVDYEVEAGLTVTRGWIENEDGADGDVRPGPNPELAFKEILDAVSERAAVSFGVDHLALEDGGGGTGVTDSPMEGGERAAARVWQFSQSRN